jgi:hypothetical protein
MPHSILSEKQIEDRNRWVAACIGEQPASLLGKAGHIGSEHKRALQRFFPTDLLEPVRVIRGRAAEPSFYSKLRALGIRDSVPFSEMAGLLSRIWWCTLSRSRSRSRSTNRCTSGNKGTSACKDLPAPTFAALWWIRGGDCAAETGVWAGSEICRKSGRDVLRRGIS